MLANDPVRMELLEAFHNYARVYFRERNLEKTLALVDAGVTGFGTGRDERVGSGEGFEFYRRDIEQCPATIDIHLRQVYVEPLGDDSGIVSAELDLVTEIAGQPLIVNGLRSSNVFLRRDGKWLLTHLHISLPWQPQADGEAFPLHELEARNRQLEAMVAERTAELHKALEEVKRVARIDSVTGLGNRMAFDENVSHEIGYARRYNTPLSMILADVDHFKRINDRYGHLKGDEILHRIATLMAANVRDVDTVHRWGGEEFMVLLPNTTLEQAAVCAEYLRSVVGSHEFVLDLPVTISLGVAQMKPDEFRADWIHRVDEALYRAKLDGRNRVRQVA